MKASTKLKIVWNMSTVVKLIHSRYVTRKYIIMLNKAIQDDISEFRNKYKEVQNA